MDNVLYEILKVNKLIKALIKDEDLDGLQNALKLKNDLIKKFSDEDDKGNLNILKKIKKIDDDNIKSLQELMDLTNKKIKTAKSRKGQVKNTINKVKKYKANQNSSGYRFDQKK